MNSYLKGNNKYTVDNEERGGSAYEKSDEWDEENEIVPMELKRRQKAEANKFEEQLLLNRRLRSDTKRKRR